MQAKTRPLGLWGGHECTVNRVGDRYFDQTVRTGHQDRISDLTRFAEIGLAPASNRTVNPGPTAGNVPARMPNSSARRVASSNAA